MLLTCVNSVEKRILGTYLAQSKMSLVELRADLHSFLVSSRRFGRAAQLREPDAEVVQRGGEASLDFSPE
jgi:hypothetical protein